CHPNPNADTDRAAVAGRGDVVNLPEELKERLIRLADPPPTYLPRQGFAEADRARQLFQYYFLDTTGFEPNVFTSIIPGVNDANVQLTVTGGKLRTADGRRRPRRPGAQARASHRSARFHRCFYRHFPDVR